MIAFMLRRSEIRLWVSAVSFLMLWSALPAFGTQTDIVVRVLSRDAKFIGSSMGGAQIIIRDSDTREILAQGFTVGSTGNTRSVMHKDGGRRARLTDNDAALFRTSIDIQRPRRLEVEAIGPTLQGQAANTVTATQWVVPGKHLSGGDGWVLEMPGFAVDILAPPAHKRLAGASIEVKIIANVIMMCGCPIEPGGLWDANRFEVKALVERDGEDIGEFDLSFAGQTSLFAFDLPLRSAGLYKVTVYAYDPENGNTGVDHTSFFAQ